MIRRLMSVAGGLMSRGKLSILIYHQVLEAADPMRPSEPTAKDFEWQMQLLRKFFSPLPLSEALERLQAGTLPRNAVCVTFDDGYRNNLSIALPILTRYSIPATVYIASGFSCGQNMFNDRIRHLFSDSKKSEVRVEDELWLPASWEDRRTLAASLIDKVKYRPVNERNSFIDDLYALNQALEEPSLMMSPGELRSLSEAGVEIGAHTQTHPILMRMEVPQQREELWSCKETLESWIDKPVRHLAYPNGKYGVDFDEQTMRCAIELGYASAVTTDWGVSHTDVDPYKIPRFTPWDTSPLRFQARLHLNQWQG